MAFNPNVVVVAPGELITAAHLNSIRSNLDRLDTTKLLKGGDTITGDTVVVRNPNGGAGTYFGASSPNMGTIAAAVTSASGSDVNTINLALGKGGSAAAANAYFCVFSANASSATPLATPIGSIRMTSATAIAFNTTSDPRAKTAVAGRGIDDAAQRVATLGAQAFRGQWIDPATGGADGGETWDFLSSHDIEEVAPYAVTGERDAVDAAGNPVYQQVNYPALVPLLTAALADALARIAALEQAAAT